MLVPRSFKYSSSPPMEGLQERTPVRKGGKNSVAVDVGARSPVKPPPSAKSRTPPVKPVTQPVAVPKMERRASSHAQSIPTPRGTAIESSRRKPSGAHDPSALPPAVAALLAVTAIPPRRPHQLRKQPRDTRQISIDELVNEWKSDEALNASYSSSTGLSVLLEDTNRNESQSDDVVGSVGRDECLHTRSTSSESVPSLDADEQSISSSCEPSTPSLRSRRSNGNLKREKARSIPSSMDTSMDHPLAQPKQSSTDDDLLLYAAISRAPATPRPKASLKSNLTTSLQALKKAALSPFSSFTSGHASTSIPRSSLAFSDETLWSHPFLFPRFTPEIRPDFHGTPTKAQRRYLNPIPLSFEEQEAPFQQALHAPFLAEPIDDVPTIQLQTYTRSKRKAILKRASSPAPNSEAGRAILKAEGVRQREPRENSDFLRVVVLEMNMRREGKLETGRAKIWLPPREVERSSGPRQWIGESAY